MPSSPSSERPPAHLPRGFGERPTIIDISSVQRTGRSDRRPRTESMKYELGNYLIVVVATIRSSFARSRPAFFLSAQGRGRHEQRGSDGEHSVLAYNP